MSGRFAASARLPRSGNAALATGALVQLALGAEFVLAGLSKAVDADFTTQFRAFVQASPGAKMGLLAPIMQGLVVPNAELMAQFAKWTELLGGLILVAVAVEVLRRRLAERHIEIELSDRAKTHLVRTGYDPTYGARPLKRAIQREVETPLARRILAGEVRDGQHVFIDLDETGALRFNTEPVAVS